MPHTVPSSWNDGGRGPSTSEGAGWCIDQLASYVVLLSIAYRRAQLSQRIFRLESSGR